MKIRHLALAVIFSLIPAGAFAAPVVLTEDSYQSSPDKAVVLYGINWGRQWDCAGFENAQLQKLSFALLDKDTGALTEERIALQAPSALSAENISQPHALIVTPGEYAITGFDVKTARSVSDIGHLLGDVDTLFKDGKPAGGTFKAGPGEIVYIGEFGLECSQEPVPWRYYIMEADFERYVNSFTARHPFLADKQVIYRLFATTRFGL